MTNSYWFSFLFLTSVVPLLPVVQSMTLSHLQKWWPSDWSVFLTSQSSAKLPPSSAKTTFQDCKTHHVTLSPNSLVFPPWFQDEVQVSFPAINAPVICPLRIFSASSLPWPLPLSPYSQLRPGGPRWPEPLLVALLSSGLPSLFVQHVGSFAFRDQLKPSFLWDALLAFSSFSLILYPQRSFLWATSVISECSLYPRLVATYCISWFDVHLLLLLCVHTLHVSWYFKVCQLLYGMFLGHFSLSKAFSCAWHAPGSHISLSRPPSESFLYFQSLPRQSTWVHHTINDSSWSRFLTPAPDIFPVVFASALIPSLWPSWGHLDLSGSLESSLPALLQWPPVTVSYPFPSEAYFRYIWPFLA